jgi:hypothetical protein
MVQGRGTLKRVAFIMQANQNDWLGGLSYLRDLASFAPRAMGKARVLHFVSAFAETGAALTVEALQGRFGFAHPFFHLPNQFWAHRNHPVVVKTLGILKNRGVDALVIATGGPMATATPDISTV